MIDLDRQDEDIQYQIIRYRKRLYVVPVEEWESLSSLTPNERRLSERAVLVISFPGDVVKNRFGATSQL